MKTIKNTLILIITAILFSSCLLNDLGSDASIIFRTYWRNNINDSSSNNNIITVNNDTLNLRSIRYVITDFKLISKNDTVNVSDYKLMKEYDYITVDNLYGNDIYQISFNFGIEDLSYKYPQLKAQDFDYGDGYYFLKMDFKERGKDSLYNYNIAKKSISSKVKSFKVVIDGFQPSNGLFVSQAEIGLNLKNLFTKTNIINIDSLTSTSMNNEILQLKMIENAENIFFLKSFNYD